MAMLFEKYGLGGVFNNQNVKDACEKVGFGNPFDATKIDKLDSLPNSMREQDCFVIHLGGGKHKFLKGLESAYVKLPAVKVRKFSYKKSLLNETDTSESNVLFACLNAGLLQSFIYGNRKLKPRVYGSRRTTFTGSYKIGKQRVKTENVQMEMDMILEHEGAVTIVEAKNGKPSNLAAYQLFMPFMYYNQLESTHNLGIRSVKCCYITRTTNKGNSLLFAYLCDFTDTNNMASAKIIKSEGYELVKK